MVGGGNELALSQVQEREDGKTATVAELWLKGYSIKRIAVSVGLHHRQVRELVLKSKAIWLKRKELALTDVVAEQLRRIDLIEMNAWDAWERSQQDFVETKVAQTKDGSFKTRTSKTSVGDPRFLDAALKCVEQRCKLLGVFKPPEERAEMTVWGVTVVVDNPEQAEEILSYEQFRNMKDEAEHIPDPDKNEIILPGSEINVVEPNA